MGSSQSRAQTRVPCIGRRVLNHCATREVPTSALLLHASTTRGGGVPFLEGPSRGSVSPAQVRCPGLNQSLWPEILWRDLGQQLRWKGSGRGRWKGALRSGWSCGDSSPPQSHLSPGLPGPPSLTRMSRLGRARGGYSTPNPPRKGGLNIKAAAPPQRPHRDPPESHWAGRQDYGSRPWSRARAGRGHVLEWGR